MLAKIKRHDGNTPVLSNLLENFFGNDIVNFLGSDVMNSIPSVNIKETKDSYEIDVAAPGMNKEDIDINLDNNVLTISAEKEEEKSEEQDKDRYTRREFQYASFRRSFTLPDMANAEKIDAKYENGILQIRIPKKDSASKSSSKKIKVS